MLVAQSLTAYQSILSWYLKLSLPVVLALGGLAFLGAYLLMGRALLPLVTLAQAAERFEEAPLSPRPDEVGALAQAFGSLLQRLKAEAGAGLLGLGQPRAQNPHRRLKGSPGGASSKGAGGPRGLIPP